VFHEVVIPTAFTPDNDKVNDYWEIINLDIQYPKNKVQVFNRWGSLVYESIPSNYAQKPWNGYFNGELLPVGSYYYIIEPNDGKSDSMNGTVSIILK
ncbi:MAG: gliding motility-associated C-terminal domain-containing protein, partial [Flavobacteriia bacterium]|nr:gliding motility-associated C-terminal domain-containing protein [Flavobacteriia bacterium]